MHLIRPHTSLERDFRMLMGLILTIGMLVSAWVAFNTYEAHTSRSLELIERDALRVDKHVLLTLENSSYVLESIGRQIIASEKIELPHIAQLFSSFERHEDAQQDVLSWIDATQQLVVSNRTGILASPIDVSDRDYVKKAIAEPWRVHIGRPIEGRLSKQWVLPMSIGLTNGSGEVVGVLLMGVDIATLSQRIHDITQTRGLEVVIVNQALTVVLDTRSHHGEARHNVSSALNAHDFERQPKVILSTPSLWNKERDVLYAEASEATPLIMLYQLTAKRYQQQLLRTLYLNVSQVAMVTGFLLLLLWWVRQRIIRPITRLTQRTALLVRGEEAALDVASGPMELQLLATEIRRLSDYLRERKLLEAELRTKMEQQTLLRETYQQQRHAHVEVCSIVLQELEQLQKAGAAGIACLPSFMREIKPLVVFESEHGLLREHECDSSLLVKRVIATLHEKITGNAIAVLETGAAFPRIHADDARLSHMLLQLLQSESKLVRTNETMRITSTIRAGEWWLTCTVHLDAPAESTLASCQVFVAAARVVMAWHGGNVDVKTSPDGMRSVTLRFPAERLN